MKSHLHTLVARASLSEPTFEHRLLDYLVRWHPESVEDLFLRVETLAHQVAVVYRNGHPWTVVAPERRALFWKGVVHVKSELVDVRVKALEVGEHELLTKDQACLRVYLNASYRFANARLTARTVRDPVHFLDRAIRLGLRARGPLSTEGAAPLLDGARRFA